MVIYGEYLFLENFIIGAVVIVLTGRLSGRRTSRLRLALSSALCGLEGFLIFLPLPQAVGIAVRSASAALNVAVAFGRRGLLKNTALFLALSFLSGGIASALLLWCGRPSLTHGGIIYADAVTYLELLCVGVLAFGFTYWFVKLIRRRKGDLAVKGRVRLTIGDRDYDFSGFLDSGNALTEPLTGKPVVIMGKDGAARLPFGAADMRDRYGLIPYSSVGVERGFLEGIRADSVLFEGKRIDGAWVAFYDGCFGDFEVLVSREFSEGGLLGNV